MGCGGSIYHPDGSIAPGKGECRVELDVAVPLEAFFYCGLPNASCEVEMLPGPGMTKDMLKECYMYSAATVTADGTGGSWVRVVPNVSYEQRFVVKDGFAFPFPGAPIVDVCRRLSAIHKNDPEKLPKVVKKLHEKKKDCPYNSEGGEGLIAEDLAFLETAKTVSQLPSRLDTFKELVRRIEDGIPQNHFSLVVATTPDIGYWDAAANGAIAHQLSAVEKARMAAEAKAMTAEMIHKVLLAKAVTQRKAFEVALVEGCKVMQVNLNALVPYAQDALDAAVDRRMGCDGADSRPSLSQAREATDDEKEFARIAAVKEVLAADKWNLTRWKEEDAAPLEVRKALLAKRILSDFHALRRIASEPSSCNSGDYCVARLKAKYDMYEAKRIVGDTFDFAGTKLDKGALGEVVPNQALQMIPNPSTGFDDEQMVPCVVDLPPCVPLTELLLGSAVRVRVGDEFFDGVVVALTANKIAVQDASTEVFEVGTASFWWVCCEDDSVKERTLHIWREEAKADTLQNIPLEKAFRTNAEGKKIFRGYCAKVPLLPYRSFCYNFKIGEHYFADYGKQLKNQDGYKRFMLRLPL